MDDLESGIPSSIPLCYWLGGRGRPLNYGGRMATDVPYMKVSLSKEAMDAWDKMWITNFTYNFTPPTCVSNPFEWEEEHD